MQGNIANLLTVNIFILVLLIFLNVFFSASEVSLTNINVDKLKKTLKKKRKGIPKSTSKIINDPLSFVAAVKVGNMLVYFIGFILLNHMLNSVIYNNITLINIPHTLIAILCIIINALITLYIFIVFGDFIPRKTVINNVEKFIIRYSFLINFIYIIFNPFVFIINKSTNFFVKLFKVNIVDKSQESAENEILMMIESGNKSGLIDEDIKNMANAIFKFDDINASDIMTHRTEMTAVEDCESIDFLVKTAIETGFSRIPIYHEDLDNIVGIIYIKDLIKFINIKIPENIKLVDIARKAVFIPKTKLCSVLFTEMTSTKTQIAIIVDEYGGTEGLVTIEDLVEKVVGNIQDEYDNEEIGILKINDSTFAVDGTTTIDELSIFLDVEFPEGDYDTVSGMIIEKLGKIPKPNEHPYVTINNIRFKVSKVEDRRISRALVIKN